jgi:ketosteroid isomerase-like protein
MTFGNMPALVGRAAVEKGTADFFKAIRGLRHEFVKTWEKDDTAVLEFRATYFRHDGKTVTIPAVTIFRLQGNRVKDGRVFYDPTPIFA